MVEEIWRPVVGYENYEVSSLGRVRNFKTEQIRTLEKTRNGYLRVTLKINCIQYHKLVHRLVAEAFIPNPYNLPQINHINENKLDNRVENLEWCNAKYNANFGSRNEKLSIPVAQYTLEGVLVAIYPSAREASRQTRIDCGSIVKVCKKQKNFKTAGGFIWRYT